jgi:hypothetical protein
MMDGMRLTLSKMSRLVEPGLATSLTQGVCLVDRTIDQYFDFLGGGH